MFHHLVDAGSTLTAGALTRLRNGVSMHSTERSLGIDASVLEDRTLFSASPINVDLTVEHPEFGGELEPTSAVTTGLLFVDGTMANTDQLIAQLSRDVDDMTIIRLNSAGSGLDQISRTIQQHEGIESIHIISHGDEGRVLLGNQLFSANEFDEFQGDLEAWSSHLSEHADILFYGCNIAGSDAGQDFLNSIALATGADVAASDNLTGHRALGGDWDLEFETGVIESEAITGPWQDAWRSILLATAVTDNFDIAEGGSVSAGDGSVLTNDQIADPTITPNPLLEYSASKDTDGDNLWQNTTGLAPGYDLTLIGSTTHESNPSNSPHGITATYNINGGGAFTDQTISDSALGDPTENPASFEFWFRPDDGVGQEIIFDTGTSLIGTVVKLNDSSLELRVNSGSGNSVTLSTDISALIATNPVDQEFIHFVAVLDIGTGSPDIQLYVNGGLVVDQGVPAAIDDWSRTFEGIGLGRIRGSATLPSPGGDDFEGDIAVFRLYDFAMTQADVTDNYDANFLSVTSSDTVTSQGIPIVVDAEGNVTYNPGSTFDFLESGDSIVDSFSYTVSDGFGATDTVTSTITIHGVSNGPTLNTNEVTVVEGAVVTLTSTHLSATDPDDLDSTLAFSVTNVTGGHFAEATSAAVPIFAFQQQQVTNGEIVFIDDGNGTGPSYSVSVSDGTNATTPQAASITFSSSNDRPTSIGIADVVVAEDSANHTINLGDIFDDEEDTDSELTYAVQRFTNGELFDSVTIATNDELIIDLSANQNGTSDITILATDTGGRSVSSSFQFEVTPVNDSPTVLPQTYEAPTGAQFISGSVLVGVSDVDGDVLSVALVSGPSNGTLTLASDGTFVYVPKANNFETETFQFIVTDGNGGGQTATATIIIPLAAPIVQEESESDSDSEDDDDAVELAAVGLARTFDTEDEQDSRSRKRQITASPNSDTASAITLNAIPESSIEDKLAINDRKSSSARLAGVSIKPLTPTRSAGTITTMASHTTAHVFAPEFLESLESFDQDMDQATRSANVSLVNSVVSLSGASIGIVTWVLRSGAFLASMMANIPAWRLVDPLLVLGYQSDATEDDESIHDIIDTESSSGSTPTTANKNANQRSIA